MIQSNSKMPEIAFQENPEFFISKLGYLQKRIETIVSELKNTLCYITPSDYLDRLYQAKQQDQIDQQWIQNYKDIVASMIQGQVNIPLMRLSQQLRHQFGGQTMFWLDLICSFAQNQKYDQNLRIWQVIDVYKHCLHLQIGEYQKNRKFRRLAKQDIQITKKLISSINELKTTQQNQSGLKRTLNEILSKIEANFILHQDSNRKLVQFLRSDDQKHKSLQFFQKDEPIYTGRRSQGSEISNSRTKKVHRERINERQPNHLKQRMITDFSVQMREDKNTQLLNKIAGRNEFQIDQQKVNELDKFFYGMLGRNQLSIQKLREQCRNFKSKLFSQKKSLIVNISISYSFISYNDFPMPIEGFPFKSFDNPFEQREEINYYNNDYEQYEDYKAEQITQGTIIDTEQDSNDNQLNERQKIDFYNEEDAYGLDYEDREVLMKAFTIKKHFGGNQWIFDSKNQEPFWINKRQPKPKQQNRPNEYESSEQEGDYIFLTSEMKKQMINSFIQQTLIICPNQTPMPITLQNNVSQNTIQLNQEQIQKLKEIFHGRTYSDAMEIIKAAEPLMQQFPKSKIKTFLQKMTKKSQKIIDGKRTIIYSVQEHKQNHLGFKDTARITEVVQQDDEEKAFDDLDTSPNDPQYLPNKKIIQSSESRSKSSSQTLRNQNLSVMREDQQSKSQSSSFSNQTGSVTESKSNVLNIKRDTLRQSKSSNTDTLSISSMSRLRPRTAKPNYNINQLLKTPKKVEQMPKDVEI